jgi:hypothetical protein
MPETAWTEDEAPPKKKGIPTWAWFCGAGCLAIVILAVAMIGFGAAALKHATDPEAQWKRIAEMLPYDSRPVEMTPTFGMGINVGQQMEQVQIQDSRGYMLTLQRHRGRDAAESRRKMFATERPEFPQDMGFMKFEDLTVGTVEIQGRAVHVIRMRMEFSGVFKKMVPNDAQERMGSMLFADLTPEGDPGMLMLEVIRAGGTEPVTDEELNAILKPFHVGPKR